MDTARAMVRQLSLLGEVIMWGLNGEPQHYVETDRGGYGGQSPKLIGNQAH